VLEKQLVETVNPYQIPGMMKDFAPELFLRLEHPICTRPSQTIHGPAEDGVQRVYLRRSIDPPQGADLPDGTPIAVEGQLLHGPDFGNSVVLEVAGIRRR
jgi:hypothetical protein